MKIISKDVHKLTKEELAACYRRTYGYSGGMQTALRIIFDKKTPARAFMAFDDDGKLMGWILRGKIEDFWFVHSYVAEKYRGKGVGTKLLTRALNGVRTKVHVYEGNDAAEKMYDRMIERGRATRNTSWWQDSYDLRRWR